MARVTVEDCIDKIPNRFELVLLASHRARTISAGAQIAVQRDNDKNPVVALREIADKKIATDDLREDFIHSMQKYVEVAVAPDGDPGALGWLQCGTPLALNSACHGARRPQPASLGCRFSVIPAKAGIQKAFPCIMAGSRLAPR